MRTKTSLLCFAFAALIAFPSTSRAQYGRHGRAGVVMGPDGMLYNTRSPEWRMSGGNPAVYQQLVQQKLLLRQQRLMRQQQRLMNQTRRTTRNAVRRGSAVNPAAGGIAGQNATAARQSRKKARAAAAAGAAPANAGNGTSVKGASGNRAP
jgi:hypothetical protein